MVNLPISDDRQKVTEIIVVVVVITVVVTIIIIIIIAVVIVIGTFKPYRRKGITKSLHFYCVL
jgi:hypothetical protein